MDATSDPCETRLAEIAGQLNVLNGELVTLIATALTDRLWVGQGVHTPTHWLTIQLGVTPANATRLIEAGERAIHFPVITGELQRGAISFDQAHTVLTRAPAWADEKLVNVATHATVPQLRTLIRNDYFEGPDEPNPASPTPGETAETTAHAESPLPVDHDRVTFGWNGSRLTGSFDLSADTGAIIRAALDEARDALFHDGLTTVTNTDALREIALRSLDHAPLPRRNSFKVMLHIDIDDPRGAARFTNGVPLPTSIRDYLTCDCDQQPVWERDDTPIGVGRTQRGIPARLRTIVERRDRGCRLPGCTSTHVEIHHVIHWANGGPTETSNLIALCSRHHRLHHLGILAITGDADRPNGITFTDRNGNPISASPRPVIPDKPPASPPHRYVHPSGERLDLRYFAGWTHPIVQERHHATWRKQRDRTAHATNNDPDHDSVSWPAGSP